MAIKNIREIFKESIATEDLLTSPVPFTPLTGDKGLKNRVTDKSLHRPQLALAGFTEFFTYYRVQMFGNTEMFFLNSLPLDERIERFKKIASFDIPVIVLANSATLDDELLSIALERNIAVLQTTFDTTKTIFLLSEYLDDQFASQCNVHGSFTDVYGVGILFVGRSGIGKSEIALDLVERGHRLVADDVVMFTKKRESVLMGTGTSLVKHFMEIRGLGIIDVQKMFGVRSIRYQKRLEIIVELHEWNPQADFNRLGIDDEPTNVLGIDIHTIKLPIFPGKNVTVITEVIALNYLLRTYGYNAAKVFADQLEREIKNRSERKGDHDQRHVKYFQSDDE